MSTWLSLSWDSVTRLILGEEVTDHYFLNDLNLILTDLHSNLFQLKKIQHHCRPELNTFCDIWLIYQYHQI